MDWKNVITTVAPWIGTALGGPLGGMAVGVVADALGLNEKTESAIKQALAGVTPEQLASIKAADQAFELRMQEIGFANLQALEKLAANDRADARKREVATGDKTTRNLAYAITLGYFSVLVFMLVQGVPEHGSEVMIYMLGALGTAWAGVIAYYFGSSRGSESKTALLARAPAVK